MADDILRNESTEGGKKIWEAVERAAERAPEWVKNYLTELDRRRSTEDSKENDTRRTQ